jgi:catechol 2,3-dioxygenase-like lactoylglutathione lyase family enzyme
MKESASRLPSIRHVDIVVDSMEKSLQFYKKLLKPLGWEIENTIKGERGEPLTYLAGPRGFAYGAIGIRERQITKRKIPYERYDLGVHHIAINVPTRKDVDDCAKWLNENGYEIEDGPGKFYNDHYYAVFFYDPDGIKLEVVCGL